MEEKTTYIIPSAEVIELKTERIICESPGGGGNEDPTPGSGF